MPEPTLAERISIETMSLMSVRVAEAANPLTGMRGEEGWAEAVRAMRGCLAWAVLRWVEPSREPDEAWWERCGALELALNSAIRRFLKSELGVDVDE